MQGNEDSVNRSMNRGLAGDQFLVRAPGEFEEDSRDQISFQEITGEVALTSGAGGRSRVKGLSPLGPFGGVFGGGP